MQRNNSTGLSLYGFHIWSDDVLLCARAKAYGWAGEPRWVPGHGHKGLDIKYDAIGTSVCVPPRVRYSAAVISRHQANKPSMYKAKIPDKQFVWRPLWRSG